MKMIRTEDAVGHVLCHDITQIIPGVVKDAVFRKGHIVTAEDIPVLLSVGKENLYVWEKDDRMLHEDEAAEILRRICQGPGMTASAPKEGKIELKADMDGVFVINRPGLLAVNSLGQMMIAARHGDTPVRKGDKLAGMRVIPLVIEKEKMAEAEEAAGQTPLLSVLPYKKKKAGVITTGSEVAKGLIRDQFTPVVQKKLEEYGCEMVMHAVTDDDAASTTALILQMLDAGCEIVLCTGGMSVDPDDRTPLAIKNAGARIISYGAPVLPGAMFLLSYMPDGRPVLGLPGCVMYAGRTVFDLVLPRLLADLPVTAADLAGLGEGGLCLGCPTCTWPACGFGK